MKEKCPACGKETDKLVMVGAMTQGVCLKCAKTGLKNSGLNADLSSLEKKRREEEVKISEEEVAILEDAWDCCSGEYSACHFWKLRGLIELARTEAGMAPRKHEPSAYALMQEWEAKYG